MEVWGLQTSSRESLSAPFTSPAMETKPRRCRPRRLQDVPLPPPRVYAPPTTLKPLPRGGSDETTRGRCKWEWLHQRKSGRPTGRTTGQDEQRDGNPPGQDAQPFLSDSTLPRALTLFSKVSPQLSNLQLPRLFLVTDRSVAIDHSLFTKSEKQEGEVTTALPPAMCNRESRFSRGYKGYGKNEFSKCAHGTRAIQDCALTFDACMEQDRTRLRPKKGKMVREE